MRDTEAFIAELCQDVVAVKPADHPIRQAMTWSLAALLYITVLIVCFGYREDLSIRIQAPLFIGEISLLALLVMASAVSAALLSAPDIYQKTWVAGLPLCVAIGLAGVLALEWMQGMHHAPEPVHTVECFLSILAYSVLPACLFFYYLRKQATTHPYFAGGVALLAAWSIGALALRLSEPTDSMIHLIQWHYLPMLGFSAAGMFLGKILLKW